VVEEYLTKLRQKEKESEKPIPAEAVA